MTRLPALSLLALLAGGPLAAQVGHPPDQSPYRDITHPGGLLLRYGHVGGSGGSLGVGPHDGNGWGLRYDVRLSGLLGAHLGFTHFSGVRDAYNPDDSVATRRKGPFPQSVTLLGAGMQANLTGAKSWHGLAPFIDGEIGAAIGSTVAADTSSLYSFGTKLYLQPGVGAQWYVTNRLRVRFDARLMFWNLKYPSSFFQAPTAEPLGEPIIPTGGSASEWTATGWLGVGLHYAF
ncbi:MAG: hypothetical protein ACREL2_00415 [Gemmatimonadales bacterium]